MSEAHAKLDRLERVERLKKIGIFVVIIVALIGIIYSLWQTVGQERTFREVSGVMSGIQAEERRDGHIYRVAVDLDTGGTASVQISNSSQFKKGKRIVLNESTGSQFGTTIYRYLRDEAPALNKSKHSDL